VKKRQVELLFDAQGGKCFWCDAECLHPSLKPQTDVSATLDHVFGVLNPLRNVGQNRYAVVMACRKCNCDRGLAELNDKTFTEWRQKGGHK
jgi:hypothetical protein